jgi:ATP-independent RNA helicase DbpA
VIAVTIAGHDPAALTHLAAPSTEGSLVTHPTDSASTTPKSTEKTSFASLALPTTQLENLAQLDYQQMTPIQAASLPLILAGKDVIAKAKTGSGKTAAFGIGLLERINPRDFGAQALVLCPTRELCTQVAQELRRLARYRQNIKVVVLCGGQAIGPQIGSLAHGGHIIVGTPGRVQDHLRKQTLDIGRVKTLVLDEADRMLDMGFVDEISAIASLTPSSRQTLLFSATYPNSIRALSERFQNAAVEVSVATQHSQHQIKQRSFVYPEGEQLAALSTVMAGLAELPAVVFCNTINSVKAVCEHLQQQGYSARALHGDLEQRDRDQTLVQFANHSATVLVATDVAARGLDIAQLPTVVNAELPRDPDVYIHRIGRTGRAGNEGLAINLCSDDALFRLRAIAEHSGNELAFEPVDSLTALQQPEPPAMVTLCIAGGRKDKLRPGDILGALTGKDGINGSAVGKIDVLDYCAYVAITREQAKRALTQLESCKIKNRKFKVRLLK